jgi:hypothetical protein
MLCPLGLFQGHGKITIIPCPAEITHLANTHAEYFINHRIGEIEILLVSHGNFILKLTMPVTINADFIQFFN